MKITRQTPVKDRYEFLLKRCNGCHETTMQKAYDELKVQQSNKAQDHPDVIRNIAKVKEFINYGKSINNERD